MRNKVNIYSTGFPDQLASNAEKDSTEFGLKVGQAIQYEWFRREGFGGDQNVFKMRRVRK